MTQKRTETSHITEEMWIALKEDSISSADFCKILEHTCDCTWCADRLASIMDREEQEAVPPAYLTEQILERVGQLDIQAAVTIRRTSKRIQLLLYSLKVSAAVVFSILILVLTANFQEVGFTQIEKPAAEQEAPGQESEKSILDRVNEVTYEATEKMNEFANQILNGGKKK